MSGFAPCPVFEPRPSARYRVASLALHALAAATILVAQIPVFLKLTVLGALAASVGRSALVPRVARIERRADGRWTLAERDGRRTAGVLDDDCVVYRHLVVVALRDGWRRVFVAVPSDSLPADEFRRLRVWLRWAPPPLC